MDYLNCDLVTIDNGVFSKYLGKAGMEMIIYPSTDSPAKVYNQHIRRSDAKYICFIHADASVNGFMDAIERTIKKHPDFGALGAVGSNRGTIWSRKGKVQEVMTVDSCCIIINTEHGLFFDEKDFDSFHLYVEDYCMQTIELGLKNYTLDLNAYEYAPDLHPISPFFIHHSHTWNRLGSNWGDYNKYRKILATKFPDVETT